MMKRRGGRSNSVTADLAELHGIHETLRRHQVEQGELFTEQKHARGKIERSEAQQFHMIAHTAAAERKEIEILRAKADAKAKPPPMVAAMGELFLKSRAIDREKKDALQKQRAAEKVAKIESYKRRQERLLERTAAAKAAEAESRQAFATDERKRRLAALEHSLVSLRDERSRSVMSMIEERQERRSQRLQREAEARAATREAIDRDRAASCSPSLFLQLPPLVGVASKWTRSDVAATDKAVLRQLREDEALRRKRLATPLRVQTVGDTDDANDVLDL